MRPRCPPCSRCSGNAGWWEKEGDVPRGRAVTVIVSYPCTDTETKAQRWVAIWNATLGFGVAKSSTPLLSRLGFLKSVLDAAVRGRWEKRWVVLFPTVHVSPSPHLTKSHLIFYKLLFNLLSFPTSHQSWTLRDPWAHCQRANQWGELQLPGQRGVPVQRRLPPDRHVCAHLPAGSSLVRQDPFLCA